MSEACPLWYRERNSSEYVRWLQGIREKRRERTAVEHDGPSCPFECWTCS